MLIMNLGIYLWESVGVFGADNCGYKYELDKRKMEI